MIRYPRTEALLTAVALSVTGLAVAAAIAVRRVLAAIDAACTLPQPTVVPDVVPEAWVGGSVSVRRVRITWWLPSKSWRDDGWRWRVATLVDKLPGQCWCDLVEWALRRHEDDPDTPWNDLRRRIPLRRQTDTCRSDALQVGTCYCSKVRTADADADMCARGATPAAVIVKAVDR